jgi:hypothetical protein
MPDARCPMPDARCPMPDARCPMFATSQPNRYFADGTLFERYLSAQLLARQSLDALARLDRWGLLVLVLLASLQRLKPLLRLGKAITIRFALLDKYSIAEYLVGVAMRLSATILQMPKLCQLSIPLIERSTSRF